MPSKESNVFKILTWEVVVAQLVERGCFRYQRSAVQIQTSAKIHLYQTFVYCQLCIEKTKIKKKRPGMAHF